MLPAVSTESRMTIHLCMLRTLLCIYLIDNGKVLYLNK